MKERQSASPSSFILYPFALLSEPVAILARVEEGFDHLGLDKVAVVLVELAEPEVPAAEVEPRLGRVVRVAVQVAIVLHQHEGTAKLGLYERRVLGHASQRPPARRSVGRSRGRAELIYGRLPLGRRGCDARVREELVHELRRRLR